MNDKFSSCGLEGKLDGRNYDALNGRADIFNIFDRSVAKETSSPLGRNEGRSIP
jgi:hypothetical protein